VGLLLGYLAGLLTLINPCVLPILPIVLVTSLQAGRSGPLVLAVGMSLSFVTLGLFVAVLGRTFGITEETVSNVAAILMIGFGLVLLVPQLSARFATATAGISTQADSGMDHIDRDGLRSNLTCQPGRKPFAGRGDHGHFFAWRIDGHPCSGLRRTICDP
jgi:cytochrome c-type biogenesis protein